jgi:hypothetical protein
MATEQIPNWTDTDEYNQIGLGPSYLPGTWTIEGLEVGIDVDTKKAKGADGPTSTDNGLDAAKFKLVGQLTERDWPLFQALVPDISPRRPGRDRAPIELLHPDTELLGIRNVRILNIKLDPPTARDGRKVTIEVVEWFDKPKETKSKKNAKDEKPIQGPPAPAQQLLGSVQDGVNPDGTPRFVPLTVLDYADRRRELDKPLPDTTSTDAVMGNLFAAGNPGGAPPP